MRRAIRGRRPPIEAWVLLALALAAGGLFLRTGRDGSRAPGLEDVLGNASDLECLKRAVEGSGEIGRDEAFEPTQADVRRIAERVERVRGLRFAEIPRPTFVSGAEMVELAAGEDPGEPYGYEAAIALIALGAIEPDTDLDALTSGGEGLLGFYEPDTGEVVVVDDVGSVGVTAAHELVHALTDQALGFPEAAVTPRDFDDEDLALAALVEGDATFASSMLSPAGAFEAIFSLALGPLADDPEVPHFLVREALFPYAEGMAFVCGLWSADGWPGVDAAYDRPPVGTHQVLFPDRYAGGEAVLDPRDPDPPEGWIGPATDPWGAASLLFLFEAPGGSVGRSLDRPRERAAAWAGGEVHVLLRDSDQAVVLALAQRPGELPLCGSIREWYLAAFPDDAVKPSRPGEGMAADGARQDASLRCAGHEVRLGIAPKLADARRLAA